MLSVASCFPGQMPFHQQAVDIVIGVPSAALVNCPCAFSKGQCRNAVILRDNDIPALTKIDEGNVHRISTGADDPNSAVIRCQPVIGIAYLRRTFYT